MTKYAHRIWRVGSKEGRTIYVQLGNAPGDSDVLIGVMDSRELAERCVRDHNLTVAK